MYFLKSIDYLEKNYSFIILNLPVHEYGVFLDLLRVFKILLKNFMIFIISILYIVFIIWYFRCYYWWYFSNFIFSLFYFCTLTLYLVMLLNSFISNKVGYEKLHFFSFHPFTFKFNFLALMFLIFLSILCHFQSWKNLLISHH